MTSKLIVFVGFIILLFFIFSRVNFSSDSRVSKQFPDFVLENSYIRHYIRGDLKFTVQAKRIEIFEHRLEISDAVVLFKPSTEIFADEMTVDLSRGVLLASKNVMVRAHKFQYFGSRVRYDIKEKRFTGYNRGKLLLGS